jgi:hypothetical protein
VGVSGWSGRLLLRERELSELKCRLGPVFGRSEERRSAGAFIDGVLSGIARKTSWQLAEQAGLDPPYRMQSLLGRSCWDAETLRDLVRDEVIACLGDRSGVLVVDETGFLTKGTHSVGVVVVFWHRWPGGHRASNRFKFKQCRTTLCQHRGTPPLQQEVLRAKNFRRSRTRYTDHPCEIQVTASWRRIPTASFTSSSTICPPTSRGRSMAGTP